MKRPLFILLIHLLITMTAVAQEKVGPIRFNFRDDLFMIRNFDVEIQKMQDAHLLTIRAKDGLGEIDTRIEGPYTFLLNGDTVQLTFNTGKATHKLQDPDDLFFFQYLVEKREGAEKVLQKGKSKLYFIEQGENNISASHVPLWLSILPPLLAIAMALIFKEVIMSLFGGIWIGVFIIYGFRVEYFFLSLFKVIDTYIITALQDSGHLSVIIFSLLIGGMVAIISRNGGMAGVVQKFSKYANSAKNTQLITWLLGIAIFFDDYANTLIVGNTMRPVTDRFKVSREKLAYIVDSTAAPIAAIAFVTTWIGAELGYIGKQTESLGIDQSAYSVFLSSMQFSYYPILTLIFVLMLIIMKRDFGSMKKAEMRSRLTGDLFNKQNNMEEGPVDASLQSLEPIKAIRYQWQNAVFPILTVIFVTILGLVITGSNNTEWDEDGGILTNISLLIGAADSYISLLWGSFSGVAIAIILTLTSKTLSFRYTIESMMDGFKTMLPAVVILILAWSLAEITINLHTAEFLTSIFSGTIEPHWMPLITFILAGAISFSTGSSWSTMAILYPLILPTTWTLGLAEGLPDEELMMIMYNVTAVVLAGSVFGDHCSPISDTTVLSSLATSCNHIDHVRTQLPYALSVGMVSILLGGVLAVIGLPWWINFPLGIIILFLIIRFFGKPIPEYKRMNN